MGLLDRIAKAFGYVPRDNDGRRRWESAKTNRLNEAHWEGSTSATNINVDLSSYLTTLRERSAYELANNAYVAGCCETHTISVVGDQGPVTQIHSDYEPFNDWLESVWRDWWTLPDINGILTGADFLRLWVRSEWWAGDYVTQITTDKDAESLLQLRLHAINPRRLLTPPAMQGSREVSLGVKRTKTGKPISYFIEESDESVLADLRQVYAEIPADQIIHGFTVIEPGQARGIPLLASCLDDIASLRDWDEQVLDAARAAADYAAILTTKHPEAKYIEVQEQAEIYRRTLTTAPPGWEVTQLKPEQPTTNYVEFRHERLRAIGRVASMPLMAILLDSSNHNYSSARFDNKVFDRGNEVRQQRYGRHIDRLVRLVEREARLADPEAPPAPDRWGIVHVWPSPPHVDPTKESTAEAQLLMNGTITYADACSTHGRDWESVIAQREREKARLEAAGLPIPWEAVTITQSVKHQDDNEKHVDEDGNPVDEKTGEPEEDPERSIKDFYQAIEREWAW